MRTRRPITRYPYVGPNPDVIKSTGDSSRRCILWCVAFPHIWHHTTGLTMTHSLDLMWSDPDDIENWAVSPRGAGWLFGGSVTSEFNHVNSLRLIARAHQLVQEGYKYMFDEQLVTVWSAPNYCYRCGNMASILTIREDGSRGFTVYEAAEENERDKGMLRNRKMVSCSLLCSVCESGYNEYLGRVRCRILYDR